jgi:hypothetical protein
VTLKVPRAMPCSICAVGEEDILGVSRDSTEWLNDHWDKPW